MRLDPSSLDEGDARPTVCVCGAGAGGEDPVLTVSRCFGGYSWARYAAPARDSPPCCPSRSTAPGTPAAPPRSESPALTPATGIAFASRRRASSPAASSLAGAGGSSLAPCSARIALCLRPSLWRRARNPECPGKCTQNNLEVTNNIQGSRDGTGTRLPLPLHPPPAGQALLGS